MATILNFPHIERAPASRERSARALPEKSGSAKILMFTGIRIERVNESENLRAGHNRNEENCGFISF